MLWKRYRVLHERFGGATRALEDKQKERFAETEVQKLANKRAFSEASGEYGDDAMGIDFGMLGKAGSGQLRVTKKEQKLTKKQRIAEERHRERSLANAQDGLASSLAFTPVQGMELVDPSAKAAAQRVREANEKYFGTASSFRNVG